MKINYKTLAKMIDHSLLHPVLTDEEIIKGCNVAMKYDVATVCIKPYAIDICKDVLSGSDVGICSVVSFPHGSSATKIKLKETEEALASGADEIDAVINVGKVLSGDYAYVKEEIGLLNDLVLSHNALLKVIFENDFLNDDHIIKLCGICSDIQVAFVKTSTGYGFVKQENGMYSYNGATDHHLKIMRKHCSSQVRIKAAGGIRKLDDLLRVFTLGAERIGATATIAILEEAKLRGIK